MLLLGIDIGTSSIKASVVDVHSQECIASAQYPEKETDIISIQTGWAEQSPEMWWEHVQLAILKLHAQQKYKPKDIAAIGIAYQMHGLVMVDKDQQVLRNSIIWCDSRAVQLGDKAFEEIGKEKCLLRLLNSPGNFTASKLAWVKQNEPAIYDQIDKIMLPGDFISLKLTGKITTSISSLSEGVFWDFQQDELSKDVFDYYGLSTSFIPEIHNVLEEHGKLSASVADALSLKEGIPVSYKAGDQPNNALSLNVLQPGEVAATAGTSGVIYGVSDQLSYDNESRVNSFAHVNYTKENKRLGILLCINGSGILNKWIKKITGNNVSYDQMNARAKNVEPGSEELMIFPFGNGAERMLENKIVGAQICNLDLNKHNNSHLYRAALEGVAFAFRYGLDIMKGNGIHPTVIRAGNANMFLSEIFSEIFTNVTGNTLMIYNTDGSVGAARAAGVGAGIYSSLSEGFEKMKVIRTVEPDKALQKKYSGFYNSWENQLQKFLKQ